MNIGKMILAKNKKLINRGNFLGGIFLLLLMFSVVNLFCRNTIVVGLLFWKLRLLYVFAKSEGRITCHEC